MSRKAKGQVGEEGRAKFSAQTWDGDVAQLVRAWDRHAGDVGSIPRCGEGFSSRSQLSVWALLRCLYSTKGISTPFVSSTEVTTFSFLSFSMFPMTLPRLTRNVLFVWFEIKTENVLSRLNATTDPRSCGPGSVLR